MRRARRGPVLLPIVLVAYAERTACGDALPLRCVMAMPFDDGLTSMVWDGIQRYKNDRGV